MYYIRFKISLLIQSVTCFYSYSIGNPFSSLLINDVTQLFLLRLVKNLIKKLVLIEHLILSFTYSIDVPLVSYYLLMM